MAEEPTTMEYWSLKVIFLKATLLTVVTDALVPSGYDLMQSATVQSFLNVGFLMASGRRKQSLTQLLSGTQLLPKIFSVKFVTTLQVLYSVEFWSAQRCSWFGTLYPQCPGVRRCVPCWTTLA